MFGFTGRYEVVDETNTKLEVLPYGSNIPVVVTYPITTHQLLQWRVGGLMIQDAMPDLNPSQREYLMTGMNQAMWDSMLKESEDEDEHC